MYCFFVEQHFFNNPIRQGWIGRGSERRWNLLGSPGGSGEPAMDLVQKKFSDMLVRQIESQQHVLLLY